MLKYRNICRYTFLITITCFSNHVFAQKKSLPDSLCSLTLIGNKAFIAFANSRTKAAVNKLNNTNNREILYLLYTKKTGDYSGASLQLNDEGKMVKCYRFSYNTKKGFTAAEQKWEADDLDLKTLFTDSACYMNRLFRSGGTDELLLCRKNHVPVNGLIYKGCSSNDPTRETSVHNKNYLDLLPRLRKNF